MGLKYMVPQPNLVGFGSTPGVCRRSALLRFVASVAPITDAKEAPLILTIGGIVGSFIIQKIWIFYWVIDLLSTVW